MTEKTHTELNAIKEVKYFHIAREKQVEHSGETIDDFLKRGGEIKKVGIPVKLKRDKTGKYLKKVAE